jgi:GT2 family glycosyltransferase
MDKMANTSGRACVTPPAAPSFDGSRLAFTLRTPPLFRVLLPQPVRNVLRELKLRILTHDFRRPRTFKQSKEDAMASECLSIIVPVHDAPAVTRRCLASLEKYAPKAEIIIVDDGSSLAENEDMLRDFIGRNQWKLIRHETPCGHSVACEAGASLSTRPYLCLLNSDTVVTPWCWRLTKQAFEHDDKIAVVGPSTSHSGNSQTLPVAQYLRQHWNDSQICDFAFRLLAEGKDPIVADLDWASGFAFFIRRSVWEQLGGFDRNLPDYGNELELCKRVAGEGYRRVWVRNAYIHHLGGQSYGDAIGDEAIVARKQSTLIYIEGKARSLNA